jgi:hypothetical protein
VAVLVAVTEGHRDQAAENRAIELIKKDGAPVRVLRKLVVRTSLTAGRGGFVDDYAVIVVTWLLGSSGPFGRLNDRGLEYPGEMVGVAFSRLAGARRAGHVAA